MRCRRLSWPLPYALEPRLQHSRWPGDEQHESVAVGLFVRVWPIHRQGSFSPSGALGSRRLGLFLDQLFDPESSNFGATEACQREIRQQNDTVADVEI
ncbi:hypothetical protein X732_27845 [Mesorhizobium sp. L2C066B000]|nr:hypothetical protein X732_27845 [Mesorhizobium sp. L2C066B000]